MIYMLLILLNYKYITYRITYFKQKVSCIRRLSEVQFLIRLGKNQTDGIGAKMNMSSLSSSIILDALIIVILFTNDL